MNVHEEKGLTYRAVSYPVVPNVKIFGLNHPKLLFFVCEVSVKQQSCRCEYADGKVKSTQ